MNNLIVGGLYRHYKGNTYKIIALGKHSETLEELVVYKRIEDDIKDVWVRPLNSFVSSVDNGDNGIPRFEYVDLLDNNG